MAVLIGDQIRSNIELLQRDTIVIKMFCEMVDNGFDVRSLDMFVANKEYFKRGGTNARTIGAVWTALQALNKKASI